MFNGIIKNKGNISKIISRTKGIDIFVKSNLKWKNKDIGSSVSCDGVCLTLVSCNQKISRFYISKETLIRSKFKSIKINDIINLEKPMKYGEKISGHFVQGHVDVVASIKKIKIVDKSWLIETIIAKKYCSKIVEKASIAINGVSLTVSTVNRKTFTVCAIPHTLKHTNLINLKKKDLVNIEIDIISKYIKKFINEKK